MNLFRWVHVESLQRRSLAPSRYVAQAAHFVCVTYLVWQFLSTGFIIFKRWTGLEVDCFL
jgi:hypothetical protein